MRQEIKILREKMKRNNIDAYLVTSTDYHGSEFVNEYFKLRQYLSGFTGSAGLLLVTDSFAGLWTDGRYFIQGEKELTGSGITLMKAGEEGVPSLFRYLSENLKGKALAFDGRTVSVKEGEAFEKVCRLIWEKDLAGEIWEKRPDIIPSEIYKLPYEYAGEESSHKLERLRDFIEEDEYVLLTSLEEIAWLYNMRGDDVLYTPVFFAFALIGRNEDRLYVMDSSLKGDNIYPYFQIFDDLKKLDCSKILLDEETASYAILKSINSSVNIKRCTSPVKKMKAVKNIIEIECTKKAHVKDGIAMAEFLSWIKEAVKEDDITELAAGEYLEKCRKKQGAADLSFETICGYEENGAIIHYTADENSSRKIENKGFLLIDSGGQYMGGTTDITRTVAFGDPDLERKKHYTLVLKSHIALALSNPAGKDGKELDEIARKPLHKEGLDFNHGTGHGVGHMLSVHEGPNTISMRGEGIYITEGMITTDEPGLYFEGKYGIRIEDELLCKGDSFESITLCPFERQAIITEMLTEEEKEYIDRYHKNVFEKLSPFLEGKPLEWLKEETKPLQMHSI